MATPTSRPCYSELGGPTVPTTSCTRRVHQSDAATPWGDARRTPSTSHAWGGDRSSVLRHSLTPAGVATQQLDLQAPVATTRPRPLCCDATSSACRR